MAGATVAVTGGKPLHLSYFGSISPSIVVWKATMYEQIPRQGGRHHRGVERLRQGDGPGARPERRPCRPGRTSSDGAERLARECEAAGGQALAVPTDVSDRAAVENLAKQAIGRFGGFDVWINDAGVAAVGRFDQVPLEDHDQVIKTDLLGTIYGSHAALKHFRERNAGILINVASAIGKIPAPLYASYAAAKFGIVGFSDALRQELGEEKVKSVRVCTVMPMAHDTAFFEHAGNYTGHKTVPIPPTYDPKVTVDALVKLVVEPQDEIITGLQGKIANPCLG